MIEEGKFDWVIQWYSVIGNTADRRWETVPLTKKENALTGRYPMKPRSLKACVGLYNRIQDQSWIFKNMQMRIYNTVTDEVVPVEALGL